MAIDPKTLHPTVWGEVDRLVSEGYWNEGKALQPGEKAAVKEHGDVWMKEYGPGCALKSGGIVAAVVAVIALAPIKSVVAMPAIVIGLLAIGYLVWQNFRQITPSELKALAPALHLTPIQKQYVNAILTLDQLALADDTKAEVVQQLNRLMDEEVNLRAMKERSGLAVIQHDISAERNEILKGLEATTDPISRQALTRSLEICEQRMAVASDKGVIAQRIDSQLLMIGQSMGSMCDSLQRIHTAPIHNATDLDLAPIRQAIESAHIHATALRSAVDEVQSVSG